MKKVVFILGAARSGSTLLDIVLGNGSDAFSCGEMFQYPKRRGIPHGGLEDAECDAFWQQVRERVCSQSGMDFDTLKSVTDQFEYHASFFNLLLSNYASSRVETYSRFINLIFDTIFELSGKSILIDSSKRPARALALHQFLHYDVYIIYLVRNPVQVIRSFAKKDVEQASKGWLSANLYYFIANAFSCMVEKKFPKEKFVKIYYESFLRFPIEQLSLIEHQFEIDLSVVKERIQFKQPLKVGYLFDGNRIRMQRSLTLHQHVQPIKKRPHELITSNLNRFWWNDKVQTLSREEIARVI